MPDNRCANMRAEISPHFLVVAIRLDGLRKIREVVAVTAGVGRAKAVLAAMRGGMIKSLIIDSGRKGDPVNVCQR